MTMGEYEYEFYDYGYEDEDVAMSLDCDESFDDASSYGDNDHAMVTLADDSAVRVIARGLWIARHPDTDVYDDTAHRTGGHGHRHDVPLHAPSRAQPTRLHAQV
jgi:hypothetical protein